MKPRALVPLLAHSFRNNRKVLVTSPPGYGKSDIITLAARQAEADLILMHPAVSDPTDFKGMPALVRDEQSGRSLAEFLPYGGLRKLIEATSLTVCFMDDIGQAPHAVQAALMQPLHAREIDGHKISPHVVFAGATNDSSHMAGATSILEPVKSRWHTIVPLEVDVDDWVKWAMGPGQLPPEVIAFSRLRPSFFTEPFKPTKELKNSPSPRTITNAGGWIKIGIEDPEVLVGAVGEAWTAEFLSFLKVYRSMPDLDEILAKPKTATLPGSAEASLRMALCTALAYRADKSNFQAVIDYISRLPKEYEVFAVRDAVAKTPKLGETATYTKWSLANTHAFA